MYVIHETGSQFGNSKRKCLEGEVSDLEICSANKSVRHSYREEISEFKKGYQPAANSVQNGCDLLEDCHTVLSKWKNHFYQLLNVHRVNDVGQVATD